MWKLMLTTTILLIISQNSFGQEAFCPNPCYKHEIKSKYLNENRDIWVSTPLEYNDTLEFEVIYVLDAEWRFDLIRNMAFDLGANKKVNQAIIVGIPHVNWQNKRGVDLTFSQSRVEYDGDMVDSTWYNDTNSGGALNFYNYLTKEVIEFVGNNYKTNGIETLIGHSYGGYFAAYLISTKHPFEKLHIYDPSIWFSDGEVIKRIQTNFNHQDVKVFLTYQPKPKFHSGKIEELVEVLKKTKKVELKVVHYLSETHNSLFLDSFYQGIFYTHGIEK
ncbi:MAG: alpha/beta hydrolase [Bacteroidia bacterium]